MDAFYASIEQRDNPQYRGKPLVVGYSEERGVVAAASYEARKYGVRSAMSSVVAKRKCPHLIFVPSRFDVYRSVSAQIMDIFHRYTDLVEPLSLDEAFLDVTENHKQVPYATLIAKEIKKEIYNQTGLTASAGVSYNKFLAKIASDYNKPDGLFVVKPRDAELFLEKLDIGQFYGVGKVTAAKMKEMGIYSGYDLKQYSEKELVKQFGKAGSIYYRNVRGIDEREVVPNRIIKSVSAENTFEKDKHSFALLAVELYHIAMEVNRRMKKHEFYGRTVTLKVKYSDFKIITRSITRSKRVSNFEELFGAGKELLRNVDLSRKPVRLIGLGVSNNSNPESGRYIQLELDLF